MADFYVKSGSGVLPFQARTWAVGDRMVPTYSDGTANANVGRQWVWECTVGGTSTSTPPTWPSVGSVVQDSSLIQDGAGVTWIARRPGWQNSTTRNWAYATPYFTHGVLALAGPGDRIFVSHQHNETNGTTVAVAIATACTEYKVLCVDDSQTDPALMTLADTATITWIGGSGAGYGITVSQDSIGYVYGIRVSGQGNTFDFFAGDRRHYLTLEKCYIEHRPGNATMVYGSGGSSASGSVNVVWKNVWFSKAASSMTTTPIMVAGNFKWQGGGILTPPTSVSAGKGIFRVKNNGKACRVVFEGVDFTNLPTYCPIFESGSGGAEGVGAEQIIRNCKFSSAWLSSGAIIASGPMTQGVRVVMSNANDGSSGKYNLIIQDFLGTIKSDTTVYRQDGASFEENFALQMTASSSADFPVAALASQEMLIWNDITQTSRTIEVEVGHNGAGSGVAGALTDKDIWLEVQYMGTNGSPLTEQASSAPMVLSGATAHATSSATWVGLSSPVKQKLTYTFVPQESGFIQVVVRSVRSLPVWVCPKIKVS